MASRIVKSMMRRSAVVGQLQQQRRGGSVRIASSKSESGATVERDMSAVAKETREAVEGATRAVEGASRALAVVGVVQLGIGAWWGRGDPMWTAQSVVAFGLPMSAALVMRRSVKPVVFFKKMEDKGRLQVLTLALQAFKILEQLFVRLTALALACALALSLASLLSLLFLG